MLSMRSQPQGVKRRLHHVDYTALITQHCFQGIAFVAQNKQPSLRNRVFELELGS
jgi:hypothetical protein